MCNARAIEHSSFTTSISPQTAQSGCEKPGSYEPSFRNLSTLTFDVPGFSSTSSMLSLTLVLIPERSFLKRSSLSSRK